MKSWQQSTASVAVALLGLAGAAVNGLGFVACDVELTKMVRGLGFLAPLLLVGPLGIGLLAVGLLEAVAATGLFVGAVLLLCRRRAALWLSLAASVSGLLAGLLLVSAFVPAPLVFGKEMAGLPTEPMAWTIFVFALVTTISAVALVVSRPKQQPYPA
ncbi:MAG: hypothetical protein VYA67_06005 [Actinomycetota bacterium]|uniref:Transmembrane protein n=1 Tax=Mycobacterium lentiflavum TaxID=141349 RepID=A0ABY3UYI1_MYCLN|nr:hypothetical protein [Mycobacterium lentiflavum]MEE3063505.1 hypothetical protein [Actinomycetota bacterium]ULP42764.1 hypothetical protein MJO58_01725 [Mycobacterium lentiflavum]